MIGSSPEFVGKNFA